MIESADEYEPFESCNNHMCRICLEEDEEPNLIYPCKCKGSAKYVHKNCLNEWRTTSENQHNFKRCELCHFEYKIASSIPIETTCSNDCRKIMRNSLPLYALFSVFSFLLGIGIKHIDSGGAIIKNLPDKDDYSCSECVHPIYYVLGASIIILFQIFIVLKWFLGVKNKKLYCNIYLSKKGSIISVLIVAIAVALLFDWLPGIVILEMAAIKMFQIHFHSIDMLKNENSLDILNYDEEIEEESINESAVSRIEMISDIP